MKPYRHGKTAQARGAYGRFRQWTLADFNTGTAICPQCGAINPYTLISFEDAGGFTQTIHHAPPTLCNQCGASLTGSPDPRAPGDYESGDADRITPDAAGDAVTADEPARPVDTLRVAWNAAHIIARLRGYQSDAYRRMQGVFDSMRAYSRLTPQSA